MKLRNVIAALGMVSVAGPVMMAAMPAAIADTATVVQQRRTIPDWDLGDDSCADVTIKSKANNQYVAAEVEYGGYVFGQLRARSGGAGAWEKFSICPQDGYQTLYSYGAQRYVSAEKNYTGADKGMLRARATSVASFEKFQIVHNKAQGYYTIKSLVNGKYVSAELAYTGGGYAMLRARADSVGDYEKFLIS
ncbi:hypothetical protein ABZU32_22800 [Sphaerisporangium sp. NPDC005288]|uniref:fascin domain-containing protein n=1 Tax=Sphaerisporangium sp. NPDC005288 TaxID=3155114 RepID=UPI0033AEE6C2